MCVCGGGGKGGGGGHAGPKLPLKLFQVNCIVSFVSSQTFFS